MNDINFRPAVSNDDIDLSTEELQQPELAIDITEFHEEFCLRYGLDSSQAMAEAYKFIEETVRSIDFAGRVDGLFPKHHLVEVAAESPKVKNLLTTLLTTKLFEFANESFPDHQQRLQDTAKAMLNSTCDKLQEIYLLRGGHIAAIGLLEKLRQRVDTDSSRKTGALTLIQNELKGATGIACPKKDARQVLDYFNGTTKNKISEVMLALKIKNDYVLKGYHSGSLHRGQKAALQEQMQIELTGDLFELIKVSPTSLVAKIESAIVERKLSDHSTLTADKHPETYQATLQRFIRHNVPDPQQIDALISSPLDTLVLGSKHDEAFLAFKEMIDLTARCLAKVDWPLKSEGLARRYVLNATLTRSAPLEKLVASRLVGEERDSDLDLSEAAIELLRYPAIREHYLSEIETKVRTLLVPSIQQAVGDSSPEADLDQLIRAEFDKCELSLPTTQTINELLDLYLEGETAEAYLNVLEKNIFNEALRPICENIEQFLDYFEAELLEKGASSLDYHYSPIPEFTHELFAQLATTPAQGCRLYDSIDHFEGEAQVRGFRAEEALATIIEKYCDPETIDEPGLLSAKGNSKADLVLKADLFVNGKPYDQKAGQRHFIAGVNQNIGGKGRTQGQISSRAVSLDRSMQWQLDNYYYDGELDDAHLTALSLTAADSAVIYGDENGIQIIKAPQKLFFNPRDPLTRFSHVEELTGVRLDPLKNPYSRALLQNVADNVADLVHGPPSFKRNHARRILANMELANSQDPELRRLAGVAVLQHVLDAGAHTFNNRDFIALKGRDKRIVVRTDESWESLKAVPNTQFQVEIWKDLGFVTYDADGYRRAIPSFKRAKSIPGVTGALVSLREGISNEGDAQVPLPLRQLIRSLPERITKTPRELFPILEDLCDSLLSAPVQPSSNSPILSTVTREQCINQWNQETVVLMESAGILTFAADGRLALF